MNKKQIDVVGTSLPFYTYESEGIRYYEFDASQSSPPEPMVNAMRGLALLTNEHDVLIMINAQEPTPFYARIQNDFEWEVETLPSEDIKIFFKRRI